MDRLSLEFEVNSGIDDLNSDIFPQIVSSIKSLGFSQGFVRKASIVLLEGHVNICLHTHGGAIKVEMKKNDFVKYFFIDHGPGISDVEKAMTPGFSTAPGWAIDLGYGAGLGIVNMKNNSSEFFIQGNEFGGTTVYCMIEEE